MYDEGVVIGRIVGRDPGGPNNEFMVLEDRSNPQYPNVVAAELYGDRNRALFNKVGIGDLARVVGCVRSFKSKVTGKWFTTFAVFGVTNLNAAAASVSSPITVTPAPPRSREPGEDAEEMPF